MDIVKIDHSFIDGMAVSGQRLAIVKIIIKVARTLGLTVIAEGIENEAQRDLLVSLGCAYGQGYLLERPAAADEAEALARARSAPRLDAITSNRPASGSMRPCYECPPPSTAAMNPSGSTRLRMSEFTLSLTNMVLSVRPV